VRLPADDERILILGRTGSGKTHEGLWQLSQRSFDEKPWIVFDGKGDDLASRIPVNGMLTMADPVPADPGLWAVRVTPDDVADQGSDYLMAVCERRNTGVFIDEGLPWGQRNRGLRTLLSQGRSFGCPLILLSQRPANIEPYAYSESDFIQSFHFALPEDQERVHQWVPRNRLDFEQLRGEFAHYSYIYNVKKDELEWMEPAPPWEEIYGRILLRLPRYETEDEIPLPRQMRI
jgi:hypothetical protein